MLWQQKAARSLAIGLSAVTVRAQGYSEIKTLTDRYACAIFNAVLAIGPVTSICHQNAAQKFIGQAEVKRSGSSASGVPANTSPIKLIASDIPVTMHTVRASA